MVKAINIKNKNLTKYIMLYMLNVLCLSPIMIYSGQNFSVDSYNVLLTANDHTTSFIGSYRWFGAVLYRVYLAVFNHNPILDSTIDSIIFILASAAVFCVLSVNIYKLMAHKSASTYIAINLSIMLSIMNVWFCDILSFPECVFISTIAIVFCFSAIIIFMKNRTLKGYIFSGVLLVLATGVYQQFLFVFTIYVIAICSVEIFRKNERTLVELFKRYIKPVVLIFTSGVIYFVIANLVQKVLNIKPIDRAASSLTIVIENFIYFATHQHSYLKGRGSFDSEIMTFCFLTVGVVWLTAIFMNWLKNKKSLQTIMVCLSFLCGYISAYATVLISANHSLRGLFPLFSVFALFTIGSLVLIKREYVKVILCIVLTIALTANTIVAVKNEINLKKQNDIDKIWSEQIIDKIYEYEDENQEITQIYFCFDSQTDIAIYTESAVLYDYSLRSMINYYANRNFKAKEMISEEKQKYFNNKEWTTLNTDEQMIFIEDTLYLCCY